MNLESSPCHVSVQKDPQDDFPYPHLWHLLQCLALASLLVLKHQKQPLLELWRREDICQQDRMDNIKIFPEKFS